MIRQQLSVFKFIKASIKLLFNPLIVNTEEQPTQSSELPLCSNSPLLRVKRKHMDTDEPDIYDKMFNLPALFKIWKHTPKVKSSDKTLVYSFVRESMRKSSTSMISPTFPVKEKGFSVKTLYNLKKGRKCLRNIKKRKRTKVFLFDDIDLSDTFYEAKQTSSAVDYSYPSTSQSPQFVERPLSHDSDASGETIYADDVVQTSDFSCITELKAEWSGSEASSYKSLKSFRRYKSIKNLKAKSEELDELINELKKEFSTDTM